MLGIYILILVEAIAIGLAIGIAAWDNKQINRA